MDAGTTVYKAYTSNGSNGFFSWVMRGEVVVMPGGLRMVSVQSGETMHAMTPEWVATELEAKRRIHRDMVRYVGMWQAKADELAMEILHAELMGQEVEHGVA